MDFIGKIENICLPENNEVVISLSTNNTSILEELENIKNKDKENSKIALYYIDAYQSIRSSIFGKTLD